MAFCPQILGGGGDLRIIVLLKNECSFSGGACEVVGTLNHYKMVKKNFELCALRGGGDIETFRLSLAP